MAIGVQTADGDSGARGGELGTFSDGSGFEPASGASKTTAVVESLATFAWPGWPAPFARDSGRPPRLNQYRATNPTTMASVRTPPPTTMPITTRGSSGAPTCFFGDSLLAGLGSPGRTRGRSLAAGWVVAAA